MKKLIILFIGLLPLLGRAQGVEKIYVSTDRNVYIAGDEIWCSLFCLDASTQKLSAYSAVSYLELVSEDGTVATAKIGLVEGRGAGKFRIPLSVPTGNYRLLAYTAKYPGAFLPGSKVVSVFNTTSTARVNGGVKVVPEAEYAGKAASRASDGFLSISTREIPRNGRTFSLAISGGTETADFSLSIYELDQIGEPSGRGWADFYASLKEPVEASAKLAEYEGEIIYAAVEGLENKQLDSLSQVAVATLSSVESPTDVYVGKMGEKGRLLFFTNNIYGDRELVCEVARGGGYISLMDPFQYPSVGTIEQLELSPAQYGSLVRRKAAAGTLLQIDTLVQFLPRRQDILLEKGAGKTYHLDDYTRFPSLQEEIVEIVKELRIRTIHNQHQLQLIVPDAVGNRKVAKDNILTMLDGVVISDLSLLEGMDAMLLEDVDIYWEEIILGGISYNGVVNFITRKNYVKALQFPANVRVVDFKGVCYPVAYLGEPVVGDDYRSLLYWHPAMRMGAGESRVLPLKAPASSGTFRVVAEGLTASGKPFYEVFDFEVR